MDAVHARSFASLAAFTTALKFQEIAPPGDCTYQVGEGFPHEYAFHHLANGQVAVRFSLSHSVEVCRGMFTQIGVLVPPLPRWAAAFEAANARRAGFLMQDAPANRQTVLNYKPR